MDRDPPKSRRTKPQPDGTSARNGARALSSDGGRGRRAIAVASVTSAVARLKRDGADRPQEVTTLMGVVRLMAPIILAHKESGWTDAMIVALLKAQGFDISIGTLTVYRHRLKQERDDVIVDSGSADRGDGSRAGEVDDGAHARTTGAAPSAPASAPPVATPQAVLDEQTTRFSPLVSDDEDI